MDTASSPLRRLLPVVSLVCAAAIGTGIVGCGNGDDTSPAYDDALRITSPEHESYTNDRTILVEGTVHNGEDVEVNDTPADTNGDEWEAEIEVDDDGPTTITAVAGEAEESIEVVVDTVIPRIDVDSPERGKMLEGEDDYGTVTIEGTVKDVGPSQLRLLEVDGQSIDVAGDGSFSHEVTVHQGYNLLSLTALDYAHNEGESSRAVVYGPLTDPESAIEEAALFEIDAPSGIDELTAVVEAYVTPDRVMSAFAAGLEDDDNIDFVDITDIDWSDLELELNPTDNESPDGDNILEIDIAISDLFVAGEFQFREDGDPMEGTIEINELTIELETTLEAVDNELVVDVINEPDEAIDVDDITITLAGDEQGSAIETAAEIGIAIGFEHFVEAIVEQNLYDPDVLTQEVEFLNTSITFSLILEEILVSSRGIGLSLGMEFPDPADEAVHDQPGALDRPVSENFGNEVDRPVMFHTTRTAADRLLHGVWQSGLFHQRIGGDDLDDVQLPIELTADGLGTLLDSRIRDIHDSNTPARLQLRPLLPPILELDGETGQDRGNALIGDFLIDVLLAPEDSDEDTLVVTIALHLDIEIEFEIADNQAGFDIDLDARGDVADEPQFAFDRARTVRLITELIELAPQLAASDLEMDTETTLEWATFDNPVVSIYGRDHDQVTVGVDMEAADDYIEDDDVEDPDDD